ncbi:MAG TPA: MBL fold metallo-hydrolase [Oligoflexia bacterium]|mgnify:CR=1 FL=1|nr:MBL fold metallo-hydrolase [Oligoflexia bacterium]HMP47696.1 MBL fold metallo-hydrolase [Oligoflexia bacterium]
MSSYKLEFLGASGTVTGSKFLLERGKDRILVDCGLFQGRKELRLRNWESFPVPAESISAVILTHAHLDHTGYLPRLVKEGFFGPIYATAPTVELTRLILLDSARLQEEEARYANMHGSSKHHPALPLYTGGDAEEAIKLFKTLEPHKAREILPGIFVTPYSAGHILGAAILNFSIDGKTITFSGDIGRYDIPILPDPEPVPLGDILLCESTYGNRDHGNENVETALQNIILESLQSGGPILIPSFSIGRAQHLLYLIAKLEREELIPEIPVLLDSPMAIDATDIYHRYRNYFDEEAKTDLEEGKIILKTRKTVFLETQEQSKLSNKMTGPRIIIAGSGMATGGRILHHLSHWISKPETTVVFVGYQADGTRGDRLLRGENTIRIFAKDIPVKAKIKSLSGLSAHADRGELIRWLKESHEKYELSFPKIVRTIHGEVDAARALSSLIESTLEWNSSSAKDKDVLNGI